MPLDEVLWPLAEVLTWPVDWLLEDEAGLLLEVLTWLVDEDPVAGVLLEDEVGLLLDVLTWLVDALLEETVVTWLLLGLFDETVT